MRFVRVTTKTHSQGDLAIVRDDNQLEVLAGSLLDPVVQTGEIVQPSEIVRYLPPIEPPNILAIGMNYRMHAAEGNEELPARPLMFIKATSCLSAHRDNIVLSPLAPDRSDFEAELCAIIGRRAKSVSVEEAMDYVFGYTCANDVSARDCQAMDGQWARGKSFDTYGPIGPYVVTDLDPSDLHIQMRLNGQVMQDDSTKSMVFSVAQLVSCLSQYMTLLPGTAILTGTPGGVGNARKPPVLLRPNDLCEVEIEGIGTLHNPVVAGWHNTRYRQVEGIPS